jgi:hypothetical protein
MMTTSLRSIFVLLVSCALFGSTLAFVSPVATQSSLVTLRQQTNDNSNYNDDAFGLIFLTTLFAEQDVTFAGTFGVLSGVTALLVKTNVLEFRPLIPGLVAVGSLLGMAATTPALHPNDVSQQQVIVCAISMIWSVVQEFQQRDEQE